MLIKDYVAISIIHHSAVFVFNLLLLDQNLCCLAMWTTAKSINMTKNGLHGDNFREGIFISEWGIITEKSLRKAFRLFFSWSLGVSMVIVFMCLHCCICDIICWYMIKTNRSCNHLDKNCLWYASVCSFACSINWPGNTYSKLKKWCTFCILL